MMDSGAASLLFIIKMLRCYLLVFWCHFCQIHAMEKRKSEHESMRKDYKSERDRCSLGPERERERERMKKREEN